MGWRWAYHWSKSPKCLVRFCEHSIRIASLKIKIVGGVIALLSAYAPHNLKALPDKLDFYEILSEHLRKTSTDGPKLNYGDFNARLGARRTGENDIMGIHSYGSEAQHKVVSPNRDLLTEFWLSKIMKLLALSLPMQ